MKGLLEYLVGPGKANEHTNPRLVAGDPSLLPWLGDSRALDVVSARQVAARIDQPRRIFDVEVARGSVWHCSLSVRADDKAISDKTWLAISSEFVREMGFTGGGKAGCRWVAVHHGKSKEGNDHVHIAVSLVREDGTIASTWKDFARAQKIAGQLEVKHGLAVLTSRGVGLGDRGVTPAEVAKAARVGAAEPERISVERAVRACAAAAVGEGDFLARVRGEGLVVRARFAQGSRAVVGYSVAARPEVGEAPIWFGGGRLAKDLTLPRLRATWPRGGEEAGVAASEWAAAGWGVSPGPVTPVQDGPTGWAAAAREVGALAQDLRASPLDVATWAHVAHQGAGVYAAWSRAVEKTPGPLADTARRLAHQASIDAHRASTGPSRARSAAKTWSGSGRSAAALLAAAARGGGVSQEMLARQVGDLVAALVDLSAAMSQARAAQAEVRKIREFRRINHPNMRGNTLPAFEPDLSTGPAYLPPSPQAERGRGFGR